MPDYSKGKVYRILQDNDKTVYIGSTTQPLSARMAGHRKEIKRKPHLKLYTLMAAVGVDRFSIELVADFPCERLEQLHAEEGRHIRLNKTAEEGANKLIAGRTHKETSAIYNSTNAEAIAARQKAWYVANAEAINARAKTHRDANAEAIAVRKKAYAANNKDAAAARQKACRQRKKAERAGAAAEPVVVA